MSWAVRIALVAGLIATAFLVGSFWGAGDRSAAGEGPYSRMAQATEGSSATARAGRAVVALGRLQPAGGVVDVSSDLVGDRLVALVEEGARVAQNDELGRLDSTLRQNDVELAAARLTESKRHLEAERANAETALNNAKLALRQATDGAAVEIAAQEKRVESLRLERHQVETDLARMERLNQSEDSIVSEQELEHQRLRRDQTVANTEAAETELRRIKQATTFQRETAEANVHTAEVALESVDLRSTLESLQVQLQLAQEMLDRTAIVAPNSGTVLKLYTRPGETIAEGPVLQMADLTRFECVAEVFETDIKLISIGQAALVRGRAFQGPYDRTFVTGRVKRIGNAMVKREMTPLSPLEPVDKRVVQVVVDLSGKTVELAGLLSEDRRGDVQDKAQALVNLQVEVTFSPRDPITSTEIGS